MLTNIAFVIPGEPQGKGRARATRLGRMYTPAKTVAYESLVRLAAASAMGECGPLFGPIAVEIEAFQSVPASWPKKLRACALAGTMRPITKPDADNIAKAIADGGNGVAWADDKQIVDLRVMRWYSERPEVRVRVAVCGVTP